MWQEGDTAIGELLECPVFGPADRLEEPVTVSTWWADHGIAISPSELNRSELFELAAQCRESDEPDWVAFLWHVLAWGVMGDFRNVPRIVASATGSEERARLNAVLRTAAEASHRGDVRSAYKAIRGKVPRLGPGFFSKFLYFTADRGLAGPRCLILDSRVTAAAFTLTGADYWKEAAATYERFCSEVHRWSEQFGASDDVIEFRLYQFGRLINSARWRWLHAEASLYREGKQHVEFDDIAKLQAHRAGWTTD